MSSIDYIFLVFYAFYRRHSPGSHHTLTKQVVHLNLLLHYPAMLVTDYAVGGFISWSLSESQHFSVRRN